MESWQHPRSLQFSSNHQTSGLPGPWAKSRYTLGDTLWSGGTSRRARPWGGLGIRHVHYTPPIHWTDFIRDLPYTLHWTTPANFTSHNTV